jgi:hypothetical protein
MDLTVPLEREPDAGLVHKESGANKNLRVSDISQCRRGIEHLNFTRGNEDNFHVTSYRERPEQPVRSGAKETLIYL